MNRGSPIIESLTMVPVEKRDLIRVVYLSKEFPLTYLIIVNDGDCCASCFSITISEYNSQEFIQLNNIVVYDWYENTMRLSLIWSKWTNIS